MEELKILLAKGRIYESVYELLNDVGISIYLPDRTYFPITNQEDLAFQVVKPQIVSNLLANGHADLGFSGKDWVYENGVQDQVEEILDLGFDPVRIVAAIPDTVDYESLLKKARDYCNRVSDFERKVGSGEENPGNSFPHLGYKRRFCSGQQGQHCPDSY